MIVVLGAEVNPKMPWTKSKAAPVGSGPVPQDTSGLLDRNAMRGLRRTMSEALDKALENLDRMSETTDRMLRATYSV